MLLESRAGTVPRSRADGRPPDAVACVAARTIASDSASAASAPMTSGRRPGPPSARSRARTRCRRRRRVRRIDRARQAVVGHQRHAVDLGLGQPRVGGDDRNRRVLAGCGGAAATAARDRMQHARVGERLPSSVRTPATTSPVAGSMMSPTAFTATSAATTRPFGSVIAAVPMPPFIARSRRRACRPSRRRRRRRCLRPPRRRSPRAAR